MKKNQEFEKFLRTGNIKDYLEYKAKVKEKNGENYGITGGNSPKID